MSKFKKILGRHHRQKKQHRNAGDRHHSRKNARLDRREHKRLVKEQNRERRIALHGANSQTKFGAFMQALGPIANKFIGVKQGDGSVEDAVMNGDGTVTNAAGRTYAPDHSADIYVDHSTAADLNAAGAPVVPHNDDQSHLPDPGAAVMAGGDAGTGAGDAGDTSARKAGNQPTAEEIAVVTGMGADPADIAAFKKKYPNYSFDGGAKEFSWSKGAAETMWQWIVRLYGAKPWIMWPATVVVLVAVLWWPVSKLVKWIKSRKKKGSSYTYKK